METRLFAHMYADLCLSFPTVFYVNMTSQLNIEKQEFFFLILMPHATVLQSSFFYHAHMLKIVIEGRGQMRPGRY